MVNKLVKTILGSDNWGTAGHRLGERADFLYSFFCFCLFLFLFLFLKKFKLFD